VKKFLATILAIIYLATSADAAITIHYCMGKLYSVDLMQKDKCAKCGMKKSEGCCKSKVKIVKIQDKQQMSGKTVSLSPALAIELPEYQFDQTKYHSFIPKPAAHSNSPPGYSIISLNILHSVFRI
jgi:hypothetical protein